MWTKGGKGDPYQSEVWRKRWDNKYLEPGSHEAFINANEGLDGRAAPTPTPKPPGPSGNFALAARQAQAAAVRSAQRHEVRQVEQAAGWDVVRGRLPEISQMDHFSA